MRPWRRSEPPRPRGEGNLIAPEPAAAPMAERPRRHDVDYAALAEALQALAYPVRLELLDQLRFPQALHDIHLRPQRHAHGENPERPSSAPAVRSHLQKLTEAGMLRVDEVEHRGKMVPRYAANPVRLYALLEDLRSLVVRYAGRGVGADRTDTLEAHREAPGEEGPRLVLVHGLYEGKSFPLHAAPGAAPRWVIGRSPGHAVSLDYDPYVSVENAVVVREGGSFVLHDLRSKNGTLVNWTPLPAGGSHRLRAGDVVGVGRSLLCFVPE